MDFTVLVALIASGLALLGTFLTFRGGMPAAADDMAAGFKTLNEEIRKELSLVREDLDQEKRLRLVLERELAAERSHRQDLEVQVERLREENRLLRDKNLQLELNNTDLLKRVYELEEKLKSGDGAKTE